MATMKLAALVSTLVLISKVSAHGIVQGIVVDGVFSPGYNPNFVYDNPVPIVAGWSIPQDSDHGFVSDYTSTDMACHIAATPGQTSITVAAGDTVELQWTVWPSSHKGPMMDYLANCNGNCTTVDKTQLLFNKIDEAGLIDGSPAPGTWASDTFIANNNSWVATIPSSIAPGNYVLRQETIALHAAETANGAQAYPQCVNLEITGSGTNALTTGTLATELYSATDPGMLINIYYPALTNYTIPGPSLIAGAASASQPSVSGASTAPLVASSAVPSLSVAATSTAAPAPTTLASVSTNAAAVSTSSSTSAFAPASSAPPPAMSAPALASSAADSLTASAVGTSTAPLSFTSTATGRCGMPTKFTCYIDDL